MGENDRGGEETKYYYHRTPWLRLTPSNPRTLDPSLKGSPSDGLSFFYEAEVLGAKQKEVCVVLAERDGDEEEEGKGCCLFACSPQELRLRRMDGRRLKRKRRNREKEIRSSRLSENETLQSTRNECL